MSTPCKVCSYKSSPSRAEAAVFPVVSTSPSRIRPYRVRVAGVASPGVLRTICSLPVALHVALPGRGFFQLSGGKLRQGGTFTLRCAPASQAHYRRLPSRQAAEMVAVGGLGSPRHSRLGSLRYAVRTLSLAVAVFPVVSTSPRNGSRSLPLEMSKLRGVPRHDATTCVAWRWRARRGAGCPDARSRPEQL